ncbi:hypothetical protein [Enterobacter roggenkampii]|uniref:hypothetical protein n=1 Tax=Enterobacter roggenkampii TaxID=1812935 RepID=UPI0007BC4F1E|nr:hypothetical protein [Enterobacter roggenkampii]KZQ07975.1 hypothetical protein A3461_06470 [Enterobacter roggenkampii]
MDESRKAFEEWIASTTNSDLHRGVMLDRRESGAYSHLATENKWEAWKASRAAVEIKLPPAVDGSNVPFAGNAWNAYRVEAVEAIRAAGIKVKE